MWLLQVVQLELAEHHLMQQQAESLNLLLRRVHKHAVELAAVVAQRLDECAAKELELTSALQLQHTEATSLQVTLHHARHLHYSVLLLLLWSNI